jgi:hypothetical protein
MRRGGGRVVVLREICGNAEKIVKTARHPGAGPIRYAAPGYCCPRGGRRVRWRRRPCPARGPLRGHASRRVRALADPFRSLVAAITGAAVVVDRMASNAFRPSRAVAVAGAPA